SLIGSAKYALGTAFQSPASPPSLPSSCVNAGTEPSLRNSDRIFTPEAESTHCPRSSCVNVAGLQNIDDASSATTVVPENAFPRRDALCSSKANPDAKASCGTTIPLAITAAPTLRHTEQASM